MFTDIATKANLDSLESRLHTQIVAAKFDLMKWTVMALVAQGGLIVALVKFL